MMAECLDFSQKETLPQMPTSSPPLRGGTPPPWWDPPYPPPYYAAYKLPIPQMLPVIMTPLSGTSHTPQILPMNVFLVSSNR